MTSLVKVLGGRLALLGALLTFACQKDGEAVFDNDNLGEPSAGKAGANPGGSQGSGGDANMAASSTGGSSTEAGTGGSGAKAGTGGSSQAGEMNEGGKAGSAAAGSAGDGGSAGSAGSAGTGGTKPEPEPEPEPVTITLSAFEDSYVDQCDSFSNFGDAERLTLDADTDDECITQSLLRVALDEIPEGALVSTATLTLHCLDPGGLIEVSYVGETWSEEGVRWSTRPEAGAAIGTMTCEAAGPVSFDLKAAVVAWLGGEHNYGVYLRTETASGTDFASSQADDAENRPVLSVTYTLPIK